MLLAGDEFGNTQGGNNNVYCQDNDTSWMNWEDIDDDDQALTGFVRRATALRQTQPLLHRASYRDGMIIRWINPTGIDQTEEQWHEAGALCIGLLLDGSEIEDPAFEKGEGARTILIIFNAYHDTLSFKLPDHSGETPWQRLLDTHAGATEASDVTHTSGEEIEIPGRSLLALAPLTVGDHDAAGERPDPLNGRP
jgi:glycogen operon protein